MHRYDAMPSTSLHVMKTIWQKKVVEIPASVNPFDIVGAHMAKAVFFNELKEECGGEIQPFHWSLSDVYFIYLF